MAVFFNYNGLKQEAKNDHRRMLTLLELLNAKKLYNASVLKKIHGSSFLLNPEPLIRDRITDISFKIQYLFIASLRSYSDYSLYGVKYLNLAMWPDLRQSAVTANPLLELSNNKINFIYE